MGTLLSLGLCLSLAGGFTERGSSSPQRQSSPPVLERYGDPPGPPARSTSPGGFSDMGGFTSIQINVDAAGRNIVGDAANEPSITVNPLNRDSIAVGWRQFDTVTSNFRQAGYGYTTNGGQTWTFPGVLQSGIFRSDPVLDVDASGTFYYLSLRQEFFTDIWRSIDGGATWLRVAEATGGDKEWMTIDKTNSVGRGHIYQYWSTAGNNWGGRQFSRSTDGGLTWLLPINIPERPIWGTLDVNAEGDLYLVGDGPGAFFVVRSRDAKSSTATPTFDLTTPVNLGGGLIYGGFVNPGGICGQAWVAVDKSNRSTRGNIYVLASVDGSGNPCKVMFSRSTDGGLNFSNTRRINDNPANQNSWHWFGTMSVSPNGRIDAVWNDTRSDPANSFSVLYYSYSLDGGTTWSRNVPVSQPFNHFLGYPNQNKMGDYIGMISDNYGADIAYTATFNNEQDVYYLRVAPIVLPETLTVLRGILQSGVLADLYFSDDSRVVIRQGPTLSGAEPNVWLVVESTAQIANVSELRFEVEAHTSALPAGNIRQRIELFNYATNAYNVVDQRAATSTDTTAAVAITSGASNYIHPSTRRMKARIGWFQIGPLGSSDWGARIDQSVWTLIP